MNFKISSLRCVKYIEKKTSMVFLPLPLLFNKDQIKYVPGGDLPQIFARGLTVCLVKKD